MSSHSNNQEESHSSFHPQGWPVRDSNRAPPRESLICARWGGTLEYFWRSYPEPRLPPISHPQSAHETYHTAFLLRQILVADLVSPILDYAEYWVKTTSYRDVEITYTQSDAGRTYLDACVPKTTAPRSVRRVELRITSHDQGWSDHPELHGTRNGSWTWFEAEIPRLQFERELCRNVHANCSAQTAVITWDFNSDYPGPDNLEQREMLRSLRSGDHILVKPFARYPGWQNHVVGVWVDIYVNAVRRM